MVMAGCDHLGKVLKQHQLKTDLPHIVAAAVRNAHSAERQHQAWKHLKCTLDDFTATMNKAD
eukprot:5154396-Amphidinium_carterae.1